MPRQLRVEFAGAIYHVMSRGDRREDIFRDDKDREWFLTTLAGQLRVITTRTTPVKISMGSAYPQKHVKREETSAFPFPAMAELCHKMSQTGIDKNDPQVVKD